MSQVGETRDFGKMRRSLPGSAVREHIGYKIRDLAGVGTWEGPLVRTVTGVNAGWSILQDGFDVQGDRLDVYVLHVDGTRVPPGPNIHAAKRAHHEAARLVHVVIGDAAALPCCGEPARNFTKQSSKGSKD